MDAVRREREPVFVFLNVHKFKECLGVMRPIIGKREISVFFDLTKKARGKYPYADRVMTMGCAAWIKEALKIPWKELSDIALMIHPFEDAA